MPTKTFLNLPENKKNKIKEASRREFERVLLSDASINKIIKYADISRGIFYTYFKDIDDLYIYILNGFGLPSPFFLGKTVRKAWILFLTKKLSIMRSALLW